MLFHAVSLMFHGVSLLCFMVFQGVSLPCFILFHDHETGAVGTSLKRHNAPSSCAMLRRKIFQHFKGAVHQRSAAVRRADGRFNKLIRNSDIDDLDFFKRVFST